MKILLGDCLKTIEKYLVNSHNTPEKLSISGIHYDSREISTGDLFMAIEGTQIDGRSFIHKAIKNGASAILATEGLSEIPTDIPVYELKKGSEYGALAELAELFHDSPARQLKFIGVTGTNGKTTSAYLIDHLLNSAGLKTTLIGTVQYKIAGETFDASHTTPDALTLQKIFTKSVEADVDVVVMEVSSHSASQSRYGTINFDSLIFTNLTGDHLDYHKTMDAYFEAKKLPFTRNLEQNSRAIINLDDEYGRKLQGEISGTGFSFESNICNYHPTSSGSAFELDGMHVELPLFGRFNVSNAVGAILACEAALGISREKLISFIKRFAGVPGRLQAVSLGNGATAFVDYAHTDDALDNVCRSLKELPHEKLLVVFGCGGDRDRTKRPRMGAVASKYADHIVITSDNSRSERTEDILADIREGIPSQIPLDSICSRGDAIKTAYDRSSQGDFILVAGKGHEDYQIENGVKSHFSDYEELLKYT